MGSCLLAAYRQLMTAWRVAPQAEKPLSQPTCHWSLFIPEAHIPETFGTATPWVNGHVPGATLDAAVGEVTTLWAGELAGFLVVMCADDVLGTLVVEAAGAPWVEAVGTEGVGASDRGRCSVRMTARTTTTAKPPPSRYHVFVRRRTRFTRNGGSLAETSSKGSRSSSVSSSTSSVNQSRNHRRTLGCCGSSLDGMLLRCLLATPSSPRTSLSRVCGSARLGSESIRARSRPRPYYRYFAIS